MPVFAHYSSRVDIVKKFVSSAYYLAKQEQSITPSSQTVSQSTSYVYDGLGRLKTESIANGESVSYDYDLFHNRKIMTVTGGNAPFSVSYSYNKNNWLLKEEKLTGNITDITSYQYDKNGNQTYKGKESISLNGGLPSIVEGT